jgi:hypothetical protein
MKTLRTTTIWTVALPIIALASFSTAEANGINVISGDLWRVPEATSQNAIIANVPATAPDVTFSVNSPINFNATSASIGTWLGTGGAFNIAENTAGALAELMDNGSQGTLLQLTGFVSVTTGETFTVTHDDGLTLIIGGTDLGFNPGPTAPVVTIATYTGPSGNFPFTLVYGECCGGPAVLQVDLPFSDTTVPEPTTLALVGAALAAMGFARRRRAN